MKSTTLKLLAFAFTYFFLANGTYSQYHYYNDNYYDKDMLWEVGGSLGIMNGLTDVGQRNKSSSVTLLQANFSDSKFNASFYGGFRYRNVVGARLEFTFGSVSGDDIKGSERRKMRNLSYRSHIREVALIGEVDLISFAYGENLYNFSPYLMAGVSSFSFNPQTVYQGKLVDLQPLSTEGQGFKEYPGRSSYKLSSFSVPFGAGVKYDVSPRFSTRLELLARYAFTDYLDDASDSFIDETLYAQYFAPEKAALAKALSHRYLEKDANSPNLIGISRGGKFTRDMFMSINFKFGYVLGKTRDY